MDKHTLMTNLAHEANEKDLFTGAWLFAEHGEIVSQGAVGWRDPANTLPVLVDTVFDLASVSKQFTATAIMLLRREGLLDLDDPITKYFPEIPYEGVTIRMLLTHTSGLPDYMPWVDALAKKENRIPDNHAVIRFLAESGASPLFQPGTRYEYCNTGYSVLAELVRELSGMPFEQFLRENVFEPAGMHTAHVYHPRKDNIRIENWAHAMVPKEGRYVMPEDREEVHFVVTLDGGIGDGSVYASVLDMFHWDQALRGGKVLTAEEHEIMSSIQVKMDEDDEDNLGYGFGWVVYIAPDLGKVLSHSGGWPGVSTWYGRYIDADRVLVLLCSRDAVDGRGGNAFMRAMSAIGRGEEYQPLQTIEDIAVKDPDKSGWAAYCGKYEHMDGEYYVDEVYVKDGDLYAKIVTDMNTVLHYKLVPLSDHTFGVKEDDDECEYEFGDGYFVVNDKQYKKLSD